MRIFEGRPQSYPYSLQIVVETFTTTGFGADSPWTSAPMQAIVILLDLTGVALIFLALPVLDFPLVEDVLSTTVPRSATEDLSGRVVISTYTPRMDAIIDELEPRDVDHVVVESDPRSTTLSGSASLPGSIPGPGDGRVPGAQRPNNVSSSST